MVVVCPKCKAKLKIPDEKISPDGSRFRCPKCNTVLLIRKPVKKVKELNKELVLIAHADNTVIEKGKRVIEELGFKVLTAKDGIEAMVLAMREHPFMAFIDVALPKIYGFEVCKRLKSRKETSDIKIILITSVYEKTRYKREPSSLYGADDYIEGPEIETAIREKLLGTKEPEKEEKPEPPVMEKPPEAPTTPEVPRPTEEIEDESIERARRLVRTILSDIMLYHSEKAKESILRGTFREDFSSQLSEGLKLYNMRIPEEVRQKGDFFNEEIERFLRETKEKYST